MIMEKRNVVQQGRTPCRVCENGTSEYVCPACAKKKHHKQASTSDRLDVEELSREHK